MPIITPAYPSMCATHNISLSTKKIIIREMDRAADIVDRIFKKQLTWNDLFSRHSFFTSGYKYYLSIVAASRTREAQLIWSGLVESKVRLLVTSIENVESVELAHPFIKGFDRVHHCRTEDEVEKITNGDLLFQAKDVETRPTNLAHELKAENGDVNSSNGDGEDGLKQAEKQHTIYTTSYYIGIELAAGCTFRSHSFAIS
jgi:poly(A) polymerase